MPSLAILVSAVLVLSCEQTPHTNSHTDAGDRYIHATTIDVSNDATVRVFIKLLTELYVLLTFDAVEFSTYTVQTATTKTKCITKGTTINRPLKITGGIIHHASL